MESILCKVGELYDLYKSSPGTLKKMDFYINEQLPGLLKKFDDQEKKNLFLEKESNKYINDFLTNPEKQYFYIKNTDIFIFYDGENYVTINEDDLWMRILTDITSKETLLGLKQKIKDTIIKKIKEKNIFPTIPESYTVQHIINFFTPVLFDTKEDVKHFMALIGDNILNKKINLHYFVPIESKIFFDTIENISQYYFGNKLNISSSIRYRYRGEDYDKSRIIYFNKTIRNKSFWLPFIKENLFNILVVCTHYSTRYINADNYAIQRNNQFKNKIFYLKNNTKGKCIMDFFDVMINKGSDDDKISMNDLFFLWKIYLKNKNIPNTILKSEFDKISRNALIYKCQNNNNIQFLGIKSSYLNKVKLFKKFWQNKITLDENDEIEISEMHTLLLKWLENLNNYDTNFSEENLKDMIEYFCDDIKINDDKFLLGIKCKMWSKQDDILEAFTNKFNKVLTKNILLYDSYVLYCKYSNKKNKPLTVSKQYFYKYVSNVIPYEYIKDGYILLSYWEN
tara:strand:- start:2707 stop:4236 length:1530 start_codon:yes stop_codon:yes gene_type:complete